jgi:hypothetical protein
MILQTDLRILTMDLKLASDGRLPIGAVHLVLSKVRPAPCKGLMGFDLHHRGRWGAWGAMPPTPTIFI